MKKIITILLLFINIFTFSLEKKVIKRKILILPFQNINNVNKYQFLSTSLRDALNAELLTSDLYSILSFAEISNEINVLGLNELEATDEINANKVALKMKADVIIIGTYIIIEDKIKVQMKAIDAHEKQTVISINMQGDVDLDIFRIIDVSVKDMAKRMYEKLPPITDDYFIQQRRLLRQKYLTPKVKVGIGLTAGGAVFVLAGLPIFIYDVAGYSSIVKDNLYNNPRTAVGYQEYLKTSYTHIALLAVSLSTTGVGLVLIAIGVPLIVYDLVQLRKKMSVSIEINNNVELALKISL